MCNEMKRALVKHGDEVTCPSEIPMAGEEMADPQSLFKDSNLP